MLRTAEGTSIRSHIAEFISLIIELKNMDETFSSEQQVMMLLCSLPPSYRHLCETLIYGHENLKIDEVKFALLSCDKIEHDSDSRDDTASGLVVKGRSKEIGSSSSRGKSRFKSRQPKGRCRYRKKEGHWKVEYLKLKDKREKDSSDSASVAESANNVLSVSTSSVGDVWILDLGCSNHICPNRDCFTS